MAEMICQFGAICQSYCNHKWPHEPTDTLGCSKKLCRKLELYNARDSYIDEFNELFTFSELHGPAKCVDYNYFLENIKHGHVIVTEGTQWKGWHERKRLEAEQREANQIKILHQRGVDYIFNNYLMFKAIREDCYTINPIIDERENQWHLNRQPSRFSFQSI